MKFLLRFLPLVLLLSLSPVQAQDGTFNHKKERKKVWRRWNRKKDAYNPYLGRKKKNKPSAQMAKSEKKEQRRQKRQFKRELKRAKKRSS